MAPGAAQLAARRSPEGQQPTLDDVMDVAFRKFALLLEAGQGRAALRETRSARG
ncbi:hypothetical protein ACFXKX_35900 [Streptomyces scopuliridis]|uniref:hypothetical protein n=1 Tax=Streptomyces scopuliridis TaxID=452529 RepID=UPI00369B3114